MDPFALVILGALVALALWVWLLGKYFPGSGLEQLGLRSAREISESREQLEAEDLEQMLAAHNARRRARGEREITAADMELRVMQDVREQQQRRDAYLADHELDQLLEVTNARRRARGLPERTRAQAREEFGGAQPRPRARRPEQSGGTEPRPRARGPEEPGGTEPRPRARGPEEPGGTEPRPRARGPEERGGAPEPEG